MNETLEPRTKLFQPVPNFYLYKATYSDLIFYAVAPLADGSFDFDGPKSAWVEKAKQFITLAKKSECDEQKLDASSQSTERETDPSL